MSEARSLDQEQVAEEFLRATEQFNRRAQELGLGDLRNYYWYHTIELTHDLVTPGMYDFRDSLDRFQFPEDMQRMTVLDVGSATGFFAFEFEKRGARVLSVEIPSLAALDRFPGQTVEEAIAKIERMIVPQATLELAGVIKEYDANELYFHLLQGPFELCHRVLHSKVERCLSTIYDLSETTLGVAGFDLVFIGDVLLHTLHPLQALAAVAPMCKGMLVVSQVMPESESAPPAMLYVGGDSPETDEISWWWPNKACLVQLLKKLGFREVMEVGQHSGVLRPAGHAYERSVFHAIKA